MHSSASNGQLNKLNKYEVFGMNIGSKEKILMERWARSFWIRVNVLSENAGMEDVGDELSHGIPKGLLFLNIPAFLNIDLTTLATCLHLKLVCLSLHNQFINIMDNRIESSETLRQFANALALQRLKNKCAACFRQFNKMEHLVEHMRTSYHSVHEPMCGICKKHCRSFESLREHLLGPLPKVECAKIFSGRGCNFCLVILDSPNALRIHRASCQFLRGNAGLVTRMTNMQIYDDLKIDNGRTRGPQVVALTCKMVGGGSDGSLDLCARVCLIDEHENIIFHAYVKPQLPVTNYRYETTGIRPEHLRDAMPVKHVQRKIQDFLCNGEPLWKIRSTGGRARILVGHGLDHDLDCLEMEYPAILISEVQVYYERILNMQGYSKISPIDENKQAQQLTQVPNTSIPRASIIIFFSSFRYDIQTRIQDPYEDCVATMRLYMRMRSQAHKAEAYPLATDPQNRNNFASWRQSELERMTPEEMLEISRSDYYCWCLDSKNMA
ncbi:Exonuclease, RNase T/DNA polymerase III [Dillenia turbinata]|uniref:Exonuclease, RNase T/DNA polymerase III n=1 Tax=Dillenia turbinata TaxID=194707 RepID=A0AAN8UL03_9MAGN